MPSTWPVARERNDSGYPEIGRPSESMSADPRATLIMPSVAMNGGRRPIVISAPFPRPQARPTTRPTAAAAAIGSPASCAVPSATPASATIEPTDRSMPPVRITNVIPTATIPMNALCSTTLTRLETVAK